MSSSTSSAGRVHAIEWSFETESGVYGQAATGVVFVYDERRNPLTVLDESELYVEIGEQVMVRVEGEWSSCEWGMVVNTVRFRRA